MEPAGSKSGAIHAAAVETATSTGVVQPSEKKLHGAASDGHGEKKQPEPKPKQPRPRTDDKWKIFSGTANDALAKEVCEKLGLPMGQAYITRFSDGETYVQILETSAAPTSS